MTFAEHLHHALEEQRALLESMASLLDEEQRWIVELDPANLQGVTEKKENVMAAIDTSRRRLVQILSENGPVKTVSAAIEDIPASSQETLRTLQADVLRAAGTMDRKLSLNARLLDRALGTINHSLNFFVGMFKGGGTYGQSGAMLNSSPHSRILHKEI